MLVYSLILLLLIFGAFHYDIRKNKFLGKFYYLLVFMVMTAMTALRYRVGGDSLQYEDYFESLPIISDLSHYLQNNNAFNYQPLYLAFVGICKAFADDYYFYQIIHAIVVNIVFFWFIQKNSKYKYSVLLILYGFLFYFYFTFEVQREIIAVCCFLLAYNSFQKNKWLMYFIFAIIAFLFHISALILFVLPLFKLINLNRKFVIVAFLVGIPLIFAKSFLFSFFEVFFISDAIQQKGDAYSKMDFSYCRDFVLLFCSGGGESTLSSDRGSD